ncbi:hypothetical protein D3C72_1777090 [compost metagenome]
MLQRRLHIVGRIEIHPPQHRAKHRDPGVGCIGTNQPWLAWRWLGQQVATDVPRRQPSGTYAGEHQVSKVLADPASALQHLYQRCSHLGRFGIEGELAEDFLHQRLHAEQQRSTRRKTALRKLDEIFLQMHIRRLKPVSAGFEQFR